MSYGYLKRYTQRDKHKSSKLNDLCILHIAWILGIDGDFTLGQPKDCPSIAYDYEPRTHREKHKRNQYNKRGSTTRNYTLGSRKTNEYDTQLNASVSARSQVAHQQRSNQIAQAFTRPSGDPGE